MIYKLQGRSVSVSEYIAGITTEDRKELIDALSPHIAASGSVTLESVQRDFSRLTAQDAVSFIKLITAATSTFAATATEEDELDTAIAEDIERRKQNEGSKK